MNRITIAILLLSTAAGCGTNRSATGGNTAREGTGTITGIVTLAEGVGPKTGDFCENLAVKVTPPGAPDDLLGSHMVKISRGRCSYHVTGLPSEGEELQLAVTPSPTWTCDNGATPTITPAPQSLKLRDYQAETRDFRVSCPAPAPAAEASPAAQ